ncbi:hypothetical protein GVN24_21810 [Rhizobium sp. CRIBSB]|nr:hypothetical protein [Rhizobium sp. CRIBSB]
MRGTILIGLVVLTLGACSSAREPKAVATELAPVPAGFDFWGTGEGSYFYHHLSADCETLVHGHGRNNAWGLWRMPLDAIIEDGPEEGEHSGAVLTFRCRTGSSCIGQGLLRTTTEQVTSHAIPFETMQLARDFSVRVANLRVACGIGL